MKTKTTVQRSLTPLLAILFIVLACMAVVNVLQQAREMLALTLVAEALWIADDCM